MPSVSTGGCANTAGPDESQVKAMARGNPASVLRIAVGDFNSCGPQPQGKMTLRDTKYANFSIGTKNGVGQQCMELKERCSMVIILHYKW